MQTNKELAVFGARELGNTLATRQTDTVARRDAMLAAPHELLAALDVWQRHSLTRAGNGLKNRAKGIHAAQALWAVKQDVQRWIDATTDDARAMAYDAVVRSLPYVAAQLPTFYTLATATDKATKDSDLSALRTAWATMFRACTRVAPTHIPKEIRQYADDLEKDTGIAAKNRENREAEAIRKAEARQVEAAEKAQRKLVTAKAQADKAQAKAEALEAAQA